jgi:hypothetical protein
MTKGKRISVFAAAFLLVAVASAVLGAYFGYSRARGYFGSQWLGEQCLDIRSRLVLLSYLKSSDPAKTAEMLEDQMYDDVISLEPDRFIDRRAKDNINQTLAEVRAYRSANPNTRRPMIDRMVEKALSLPPY